MNNDNNEKLKNAVEEIKKIQSEFSDRISEIKLDYNKKVQAILDKHEIEKISKDLN